MDLGLKIALTCCMLLPLIPLISLLITSFIDDINSIPPYNLITFDRFLAFYNINPDRWHLYDDEVEYERRSYLTTTFQFNFTDLMRYKRWHKRLKKFERAEVNRRYRDMQLKEYQAVLDCVKEDLEKFTRENDAMMKREADKYAKAVDEVPRIFEDKPATIQEISRIEYDDLARYGLLNNEILYHIIE